MRKPKESGISLKMSGQPGKGFRMKFKRCDLKTGM